MMRNLVQGSRLKEFRAARKARCEVKTAGGARAKRSGLRLAGLLVGLLALTATQGLGQPVGRPLMPAPPNVAMGQSATPDASAQSGSYVFQINREQGSWQEPLTLWPGKSLRCHDVNVSWVFDKDCPSSSTQLVLRCTTDSLALGAENPANQTQEVSVTLSPEWNENTLAYVGNTAIELRPQWQYQAAPAPPAGPGPRPVPAAKLTRIAVAYRIQSSRLQFPGAEIPGKDLVVSLATPLQIDEWKLSVSPEPVSLPNGSSYYELRAESLSSGTLVSSPAEAKADMRFGRFRLGVMYVYPATRTVAFALSNEEDYGKRGAETLIEQLEDPSGESAQALLERMSKLCGFSVEWQAVPGIADSVEYAKNYKVPDKGFGSNVLHKAMLFNFLHEALGGNGGLRLHWSDRDHLQVMADPETLRARSLIELFQKQYQPQTRVYPVEKVQAQTAKLLIEPELRAYALILGYPALAQKVTVVQEQGPYRIVSGARDVAFAEDKSTSITRESIVQDDKACALIVTAIPSTHQRIAQMLGQVQTLVSREESKPEARRYRMELVLLKGTKGGACSTSPTVSFPLRRTMRSGMSLDYNDFKLEIRRINAPSGSEWPSVDVEIGTPLGNEFFTIQKGQSQVVQNYRIQVVEVSAGSAKEPDSLTATVEISLVNAPGGAQEADILPGQLERDYGISPEDLKLFGLTSLSEAGRGVVTLLGDPGEAGSAQVRLSSDYGAQLEFQDVRPPYLIVRCKLCSATPTDAKAPLLENTLYLEQNKPTLLGLTNLKEALILVARLHDKP